ncbi:TA system VapC family ribonuclease toxin [Aeromicrobium sp.]|uniref:type II toxin-antitoxin system VapC family toxin n=1 Tax=Aeromicrobium sp. TaxID=1871063 RepID=UPI0030C23242
MIAVDTNILVYAQREDSPQHRPALQAIRALAEGQRPWAVPWPCLHEFLAIVTHPRIYQPPTPVDTAVAAVAALIATPGFGPIGETDNHASLLADLLRSGSIVGPRVHDARIAAICLDHGVTELWTADRDFSYFPTLATRNPLVT